MKEILERRGTKFQFANSTSKSIYTEEDIITSIKKLSKLGSGFRTVNVGRVIMIVSVPEELDADHMQVLNYAEETPNGMVRTETWIMNDQTELWNCCLVRVWHG